ncbi:DUF1768-domain-containing protein [Xylariaceae sp. FL1651]|nr:DUF1768-domain-containing protein [Xylariaceae sp. FL1651]
MAPKRKRTSKSGLSSSKKTPVSPPPAQAADAPPPADPNSPLYFWRPTEPATGYLSQWYALPFRDRADRSKIYPTAEHYMMHHKALLFGDTDIAATILEATSPRDVRSLGRAVRGFEQAVWERERARIVTEGSWCKFSLPVVEDGQAVAGGEAEEGRGGANGDAEADEKARGGKEDKADENELKSWKLGDGDGAQEMQAVGFRDVLLATGTRELVEASPFDRIWGIGFAAKNAEGKRQKWGMNLLGKCLMEVREQFRREAEAAKPASDDEIA